MLKLGRGLSQEVVHLMLERGSGKEIVKLGRGLLRKLFI